ncbi:ankyrin repeat domain-containing protein [Actinokineospora iranica]|uniref:Ankyrin repeat-containing protein n=1 Tax=Actinokineospora iranica TaxID=1271860 RepID=A0A1G6X0B9_9PSEU|nr:ankyrin repeat domain-containing protein [Actinokineospora iranica]SDD71680.1 Ankyrin repeat-containing protein [Actinokineospora iranica]
MAARDLPDNAKLEDLEKQARDLLDQHAAGGAWATALVEKFLPSAPPTVESARLVVARQYDFPEWQSLVDHLRLIERHTRFPHRATDFADPADEFLAHACLTYGVDSPQRVERAAALLAEHPAIADSDIHTAAALGDADRTRALLAHDPTLATRPGGPHDWEPLLYLAYSRLDGGDPLATASRLLDAGADPNAGYLWEGLPSPFTALTGVLGEGEDAANQPQHRLAIPLARLLLTAGADPNDSQALYNRMFGRDDSHLRLLFEFGLGTGDGGPWHARLAPRHPTPAEMLHDQLLWAAANNHPDRVALLLSHGVDPNADFPGHPAHHGRGPLELAIRAGNTEIADRLTAAGAHPVTLDEVALLVAAALRGDATAVHAAPPDLLARAKNEHPHAVVQAAIQARPTAIRVLTEAGWDINAAARETALHQAAFTGNLPLVRLLLNLGADPSTEDFEFGSTPLDWAEHNHQHEVAAFLRSYSPTS